MGQTVPAIYHHHPSKQAILAALAQRSIDLLRERVDLALADAGDDPVDRLRNLVECIVLFMAHHRELGFLSGEIRSLEGDNRTAYIAGRDQLEQTVHEVLASGADQGAFEVPHRAEAVRALMAMSFGVALWYRPDGPLTPEVIAERYGAIALRAVGAVGTRPGGRGADRG